MQHKLFVIISLFCYLNYFGPYLAIIIGPMDLVHVWAIGVIKLMHPITYLLHGAESFLRS